MAAPTSRDIDERRSPVALVQDPEQRSLLVGRCDGATCGAKEPAATELRLAETAEVRPDAVAFEHLDEVQTHAYGITERSGLDTTR